MIWKALLLIMMQKVSLNYNRTFKIKREEVFKEKRVTSAKNSRDHIRWLKEKIKESNQHHLI